MSVRLHIIKVLDGSRAILNVNDTTIASTNQLNEKSILQQSIIDSKLRSRSNNQ